MSKNRRNRSDAQVSGGPHLGPEMDAWERQQTFREMVVTLLQNGPLSTRRRRQLVQYAAALKINPVLAGRLIAEARREFDERTAVVSPALRLVTPEPQTRVSGWLVFLGVALAAATAGALYLLSTLT